MTNAFRQMAAQKPKFEERDPSRCEANGCPYRASISMEGGKWCCGAHAFRPSHEWPMITEGLRDHLWLIEFTDEIRTMWHRHGDWRGFAVQFWANADAVCQPHADEGCVPYMNRMRGELLHRCKAIPKRPALRLPQFSIPADADQGNAARIAASLYGRAAHTQGATA